MVSFASEIHSFVFIIVDVSPVGPASIHLVHSMHLLFYLSGSCTQLGQVLSHLLLLLHLVAQHVLALSRQGSLPLIFNFFKVCHDGTHRFFIHRNSLLEHVESARDDI